jgi:L-alanine-DL-glutamate epimerase-like enolase superfamily enzyme
MSCIKAVIPYVIHHPEPNDGGRMRWTCLVKITDHAGNEGWGEAVAMWPEACHAISALISTGLQNVVLDRHPSEVTSLWQDLRDHSWWYGRGGLASFAIAALDTAIWDLWGQQVNRPVHVLLGGINSAGLPAQAPLHVNQSSIEELIEFVVSLQKRGYRSAKLGFNLKGSFPLGPDPTETIRSTMEHLRATSGPKFGLIVDIGNGLHLTTEQAISFCNSLEPFDLGWIDEPLSPDDWQSYRRLRGSTRLAIGYGERDYRLEDYERTIARGDCDVLSIEVARAEGITGYTRVLDLAEAAGMKTGPHSWSTAISSAARLQVAATSTTSCFFEMKPLPSPAQQKLADPDLLFDTDGNFTPSDAPGLGIQVNQTVINSYTVTR